MEAVTFDRLAFVASVCDDEAFREGYRQPFRWTDDDRTSWFIGTDGKMLVATLADHREPTGPGPAADRHRSLAYILGTHGEPLLCSTVKQLREWAGDANAACEDCGSTKCCAGGSGPYVTDRIGTARGIRFNRRLLAHALRLAPDASVEVHAPILHHPTRPLLVIADAWRVAVMPMKDPQEEQLDPPTPVPIEWLATAGAT